ncbi:MAG: transcriptional repressor [Clostridia bacterium]|nr:transcriptional repressor [Clostridia bacterium]
MSGSTYNTKQKQLIKSVMTDNKDKQLTCEEIADLLKNMGTPVGKTTVYRFLEKLTENGEVRKFIGINGKSTSFQLIDKELKCEEHLHLRCTECGKLFHLGCEFMNGVGEHIQKHHRFRIDNSKTVILGLCENCQ